MKQIGALIITLVIVGTELTTIPALAKDSVDLENAAQKQDARVLRLQETVDKERQKADEAMYKGKRDTASKHARKAAKTARIEKKHEKLADKLDKKAYKLEKKEER